jgi:hypothetical protein
MTPEEWQEQLDDSAVAYYVDDFALALVGDQMSPVDDSVPTLLLKSVHEETGVEFTFTFHVPAHLCQALAVTVSRLAEDLQHDGLMFELDNPTEDE